MERSPAFEKGRRLGMDDAHDRSEPIPRQFLVEHGGDDFADGYAKGYREVDEWCKEMGY